MNYNQFKRVKILTTSFVSATVAIAVVYNNIILALAGILIGVLFLSLVRKRTKAVLVDERIKEISGQSSRLAYVVLTVTLAILSLVFITIGRKAVPPQAQLETLGITFSYITLLNVALYSISYKYLSRKYGETDDE